MTQEAKVQPPLDPKPGSKPSAVIHRVCVTCNNMFQVTPDHYDAKQCPNCHKAG